MSKEEAAWTLRSYTMNQCGRREASAHASIQVIIKW